MALALLAACGDAPAGDDTTTSSGGSAGNWGNAGGGDQSGGAQNGGAPSAGGAGAVAGANGGSGALAGSSAEAGAGGDSAAVGCGSLIVDNLSALGGQPLTVLGEPTVSETDAGTAVCFDGVDDALVLAGNPIAGLTAFTLELHFRPDADGGVEQRVVHLQEEGTMNRALLETRSTPEGDFYLDTFLLSGGAQLTLADETALHPLGEFTWVALSYDGQTMRHYVAGVEEASGAVAFSALADGQTSIGVRLNQVSWFKGCVRELRCSPQALAADSLQK